MNAELRAKLLAKKQAGAKSPRPAANPRPPENGKRSIHPNSRANLILVEKGQILNPTGKNQYSAGQAFRDHLDKVWTGNALDKAEAIVPKDHKSAWCILCGMHACDLHLGFNIYTHTECLPALAGLTPIEVCAIQERALALRGEGDARTHLRKTFNPASKLLELSTNPDKPFQITSITHKIME